MWRPLLPASCCLLGLLLCTGPRAAAHDPPTGVPALIVRDALSIASEAVGHGQAASGPDSEFNVPVARKSASAAGLRLFAAGLRRQETRARPPVPAPVWSAGAAPGGVGPIWRLGPSTLVAARGGSSALRVERVSRHDGTEELDLCFGRTGWTPFLHGLAEGADQAGTSVGREIAVRVGLELATTSPWRLRVAWSQEFVNRVGQTVRAPALSLGLRLRF